MTRHQIPVTEAAMRLGLDYQQCRRLILTGRLPGGRDSFGRLFADAAAVDRLKVESDRIEAKDARTTRRRA